MMGYAEHFLDPLTHCMSSKKCLFCSNIYFFLHYSEYETYLEGFTLCKLPLHCDGYVLSLMDLVICIPLIYTDFSCFLCF